MSSCLSLKSIPRIFSACSRSSFLMRNCGEGLGEACAAGDGVGVCASAVSGVFEATRAAAPSAGRTFTKVRRVIDLLYDFLMANFSRHTISQVSEAQMCQKPD